MNEAVRVVGVVASPHAGGSTLAAVTAVLDGAQAARADTQLIDVNDVDYATAVTLVAASDAVVFGSPVYRASHTAQLTAFLEGLERGMGRDTSAPLRRTAAAIVLTGASPEHFLAPDRLRATLATFFAVQTLSPALYFDRSHFDDGQLNTEAGALAAQHGRALVELAQAVRNSLDLGALEPLV